MCKRSIRLLLEDILEATEKIETYTAGFTSEMFQKDEMRVDAVVRNLEIIGEASARLPADFREENQDIEWTKIVGLRNRIVHEYFGVDVEIVWQILESDLPTFKDRLRKLLAAL